MVKSMTSFGRAHSDEKGLLCFSVEMKSVNNRYLDLNIRMPKSIISIEEKIRSLISKKISRGKVDVFINYKNHSESGEKIELNLNMAKEYYNAICSIEKELGIENDMTAGRIARLPNVITIVEKEENLDETLRVIIPLINEALESMNDMRCREGEKLKEDIVTKISYINSIVVKIEEIAESVPLNYKKRLEERLKELLNNVELDESRIALEVSILSDKAAVDEEITRLKSHLMQFRDTLESNEPIGRKLDFIIQEMNREANTIASKSVDIEITNYVIEIKNTIEKIREQVQNIE